MECRRAFLLFSGSTATSYCSIVRLNNEKITIFTIAQQCSILTSRAKKLQHNANSRYTMQIEIGLSAHNSSLCSVSVDYPFYLSISRFQKLIPFTVQGTSAISTNRTFDSHAFITVNKRFMAKRRTEQHTRVRIHSLHSGQFEFYVSYFIRNMMIKLKTYFFSRLPAPESRNPFAKGLLSIFN